MAVGYLTSSSLIATVKREALIPTSQSTFTNDDFLAMANQEMRVGLVPSIMKFHQEYFVRKSNPIPLIPNQNSYAIPYRAIGGKFRELFYLDTSGNLRTLSRVSPDNIPYFQASNTINNYGYFYIEGNEVVIVPDVGNNVTGSLIFSYWLRPNELVDESRVGTITSIVTSNNLTTFSLSQIPKGFAPTVLFDLMQTNPGHKTINFDLVPVTMDSTNKTITFNSSDITGKPVVGDYVSFAGECIIPQAPADLHDVLSQRIALRCLQALGDQAGYDTASKKLKEMELNTAILVDNRSEGNPQKINNISSLLRNGRIGNRRWY